MVTACLPSPIPRRNAAGPTKKSFCSPFVCVLEASLALGPVSTGAAGAAAASAAFFAASTSPPPPAAGLERGARAYPGAPGAVQLSPPIPAPADRFKRLGPASEQNQSALSLTLHPRVEALCGGSGKPRPAETAGFPPLPPPPAPLPASSPRPARQQRPWSSGMLITIIIIIIMIISHIWLWLHSCPEAWPPQLSCLFALFGVLAPPGAPLATGRQLRRAPTMSVTMVFVTILNLQPLRLIQALFSVTAIVYFATIIVSYPLGPCLCRSTVCCAAAPVTMSHRKGSDRHRTHQRSIDGRLAN